MLSKVTDAKHPLKGDEAAFVIQGGKVVRTSTKEIASTAPPPEKDPVTSVAGKDGDVKLDKKDVGLSGVPSRIETKSMISNSSGIADFVFDPAFEEVPAIVPTLIGQDTETHCRLVSRTRFGCKIHVYKRTSLDVLGLKLLGFAPANVPNVTVQIVVEGE